MKLLSHPFSTRGIAPCAMLALLACVMIFGQAPGIAWEDEARGSAVPHEAVGGDAASAKRTSFSIAAPSVGYMVHVQTFGDQPWKKDGQTSGTTGQSKRLEAIWMRLATGFPVSGGIRYRTYVQTYGWQGWRSDGAESGTHGQSKRIECIQICLTGDMAKKYDVWYRVHSQRYGWMGWTCNGGVAGTAGKALRLEGIQVTIVPKNGLRPSNMGQQTRASFIGEEGVSVAAHVQGIGWMSPVGDGGIAGTVGMGKRVEALRVGLVGARAPGSIQVNAYVQDVGWQGFKSGISGTTGQSRRIEAIRMRLTGEAALTYDLYYRVHVRGVGWLSWASVGAMAGSTGLGLRIEAVQVRLVAKGAAAPGGEGSAYPRPELSHLSVRYSVWQKPAGWSGDAADGKTIGDASSNKPVEGMCASLQGDIVLGGVQYRSHVQGTGWMDWKADGAESGRPSSGKRMEAIQMRLTGTVAGMYRIWYRVNVQGTGWMGWAHDGQSAGTEGMARRIQAVQVRLVGKDAPAPGPTANAFARAGVKWGLGQPANSRSISGFGGYTPSRGVTNAINNEVKAILSRGYDVGFIMMDLSSLRGVAYNCGSLFYGASSIKAPYIASVVHQHPDALQRCQDDIQETLFYSWDYNYNQVYDAYGNDPMSAFCKEAGASDSIASALPWANYSARDLARLWGRTYELYDKSPELEILGTWCERPNISTIHATLGTKYRTRSKGGWISDGGVCYDWLNGGGPEWDVTDDGGIVYARNGAYVMAILSSIPANHDALNGLTAAIDAAHSEM